MASQLVVRAQKEPLLGGVPVAGDEEIALCRLAMAVLSRGVSSLAFRGEQRSLAVFRRFLSQLGVQTEYDDKIIRVHGTGLFGLKGSESVLDLSGDSQVAALALSLLVSRPFASELIVDETVAEVLVPALAEVHGLEATSVGKEVRVILSPHRENERPAGLSVSTNGVFPWVKQAVLLAGLRASTETVVEEKFASADHLERAMLRCRAPLDVQGTVAVLHPPRDDDALAPQIYEDMGSLSLAAPLFAAALITPRSAVSVRDVCLNPTRSDVLSVIRLLGGVQGVSPRGDRQGEPFGDVTVRAGTLSPVHVAGEIAIRMKDDVVPLLAVAAKAPGVSRFEHLIPRGNGTDQRALGRYCGVLMNAGVKAELSEGILSVSGKGEAPLRPLKMTTGGDGRLAVLGTLLALGTEGTSTIDDVDCLREHFPRFVGTLKALGAEIEVKTA